LPEVARERSVRLFAPAEGVTKPATLMTQCARVSYNRVLTVRRERCATTKDGDGNVTVVADLKAIRAGRSAAVGA